MIESFRQFISELRYRVSPLRMVASIAGIVLGLTVTTALFSPWANGRASLARRNDGAQVLARGNIFPGEALEMLNVRASLLYPPTTNAKRSIILTAKLTSVFANTAEPVREQLGVLYANGWAVQAKLDLPGAEYDTEPQDMRSGEASWSIRAKDDGTFDGLVRLIVVQRAYFSGGELTKLQIEHREYARFRLNVEPPPISLGEGARGILFVLGPFATLPGIWLFYREWRQFRRERREEAKQQKQLVVSPDEYRAEIERADRNRRQ
jgi:hypothetical protein